MTSPPSLIAGKIRVLLTLILIVCNAGISNGQIVTPTVVNTYGLSHDMRAGFVSASVGESAITTLSGSGGVITQGFLQPEIKPPCSDLDLEYYPNPVIDFLTVKDSACGKIIHRIEIYDLLGTRVLNSKLVNREADLRLLRAGVFIVRGYTASDQLLGTFKVIKIKDQ